MSVGGKSVNWLMYFSLNNIELDILLNAVDTVFNEGRACRLKDFVIKNLFEKLNPHLVEKLVNKGVLKSFKRGNDVLYTVTTRGLKAFFEVSSPIFNVVYKSPGIDGSEVARRVSKNVLFGGVHRVYSMHEKLVYKILTLLSSMGYVINVENGFKPNDVDARIKATITVLNKVSSVSFIRRIGDVVHFIAKSMHIPVEHVDDIINGVMYAGLITSEKDPRKAIIDLVSSLRTRIEMSIKEGKLLDAAAYSSLVLNLLDLMSKMGVEFKSLTNMKSRYKFSVYETLGDYFYHNLCFEAAQTFYNRAVGIAREYPELAKEAQRANAKYILSRARSLASRKRYTEAISELDRLIEYYRSTGLIRESEIAKALKREYQGEIEVLRNKSCLAYQLFEEAATIYSRLGSKYQGKALATQCKALISRGECELLVNKNPIEAVKILEEAAELASKLLSPHLKNAALSLYYESRARVYVEQGSLVDAAKDFGEAAKYYEVRGLSKRALLSLARSNKFYGFHSIGEGDFGSAKTYIDKAYENYYKLLTSIINDLRNGKKYNHYILGEALKGLLDTLVFRKLMKTLDIVEENVMLTHRTVGLVLDELEGALHYLCEANREVEYTIVKKLYSLLLKMKEHTGLKGLEEILGEIAEYIDYLHLNHVSNWREPRKEAITRTVIAILTRIKNGLETITHYLEEI